jgi:hypothetical protein
MNHSRSARNVKENGYGTFLANLILIMVLFFLICTPRVLVPPRIDLKPFGTLGMILLESNAKGTLAEYTSQKLLRSVQEAQPGTPVIELGTLSHVLGSIGRSDLDVEAIKHIGGKYGVGAIVTGRLEVEKVKPSISIRSFVKDMTVSAYVEAVLSARLVETRAGATVWSNSAQGRENVASVSMLQGDIRFDARDPEKAYGSLVKALVRAVTDDFRSHWK